MELFAVIIQRPRRLRAFAPLREQITAPAAALSPYWTAAFAGEQPRSALRPCRLAEEPGGEEPGGGEGGAEEGTARVGVEAGDGDADLRDPGGEHRSNH